MKTIKDAYISFNDSSKIPEDDDACLYYDGDAYGYVWFDHRRVRCDYQYICTAKQLRDYKGNNTMIKFDLERALAGDKVVNGSGDIISQIQSFTYGEGKTSIVGVSSAGTLTIYSPENLFMAPKKLSGFVNINRNGLRDVAAGPFATKAMADLNVGNKRIACIDLSQFKEGHGL